MAGQSIKLAWLIGALGAFSVVGSTAHSASFDCSQASSPSEVAVCSDPELSALDDALLPAFRKAMAQASDKNAVRDAQRSWVGRARECGGDVECLKAIYSDRLNDLAPSPTAAEPSEGGSTPPTPAARFQKATSTDAAPPTRKVERQATPEEVKNQRQTLMILLGATALLALIAFAARAVFRHSANRYGHKLILNPMSLWYLLLYGLLFAAPMSAALGAAPVGPQFFLILTSIVFVIILVKNVRRTSLLFGPIATIVQAIALGFAFVFVMVFRAGWIEDQERRERA